MQILYIAALAWGFYYLQRKLYRRWWDHNLDVSVSFEKNCVTEQELTYLNERIENNKLLPLPMIYLKFKLNKSIHVKGEQPVSGDDSTTRNELLSVMMRQRLNRRIEIWCSRRGKYKIEHVSMHAKSLFMDAEYMEELSCQSTLTVYPRMADVRRFEKMLQNVNGESFVSAGMQEDPFLIRGVREYQTYDSPKSINWAATAKTAEMKVNLLETTTNHKVHVFLNLQKESLTVHNELLEESIRLAKTFCYVFSKKGMRGSLWTNGTDGWSKSLICVKEGRMGAEYLHQADEALTKIFLREQGSAYQYDPSWEQPDFARHYAGKMQELAGDGLAVLISSSQEDSIKQLLISLKRQGKPFLWIIPVSSGSDYREVPCLKDRTYVWKLNYEVNQP